MSAQHKSCGPACGTSIINPMAQDSKGAPAAAVEAKTAAAQLDTTTSAKAVMREALSRGNRGRQAKGGKSLIPRAMSLKGSMPLYATASFDIRSAANTLYNTVVPLNILDGSVWRNATSISDLVDEVRLDSLELWIFPFNLVIFPLQSVLSTLAVSPLGDPVVNVETASVIQHSTGPIAQSPDLRRGNVTGALLLHVKVEKGAYLPSSASPTPGVWGSWTPTDSTATTFGYLLPLLEASGAATGVCGLRVIVRADLTGRLRT